MRQKYIPRDFREMLEEVLLRDLLVRYPELMPVLGQMDIDIDTVGGRTLVEAAALQGYEPGPILDEAIKSISAERR